MRVSHLPRNSKFDFPVPVADKEYLSTMFYLKIFVYCSLGKNVPQTRNFSVEVYYYLGNGKHIKLATPVT